MFATLVGTNRPSSECEAVFTSLCELAIAHGFTPPDTNLPIRRDQVPLDGWSLVQKGPANGKADFFLAVTAPQVPGIAPIPIQKTVSGPLFAVVVMDSCFGVSRADQRDFAEHEDGSSVVVAFEEFLGSLKNRK